MRLEVSEQVLVTWFGSGGGFRAGWGALTLGLRDAGMGLTAPQVFRRAGDGEVLWSLQLRPSSLFLIAVAS